MQALETQREPARDGKQPPQERTVHAKIRRDDDERNEHFSPDPMQQTDRYRLVTPYKLPSHD